MTKFGIYAWPAYSTRKLNPYNYIIYKHIEAKGYPVYDFRFGSTRQLLKLVFSKNFRIFHVHWPTSNLLAANKVTSAAFRVVAFFVFLKVIKILGKKVFWTVHNIEEHEVQHPRLTNVVNNMLYKNVNGFISMNRTGMQLIQRNCEFDPKKRVSLINHPHYKDYYSNFITREDARRTLGIPQSAFVFLFAGQIRRYKNVPALIRAFLELNEPNCFLIISGRAFKDVDIQQLESQINGAPNILLIHTFIEEDNIQIFMNAADLVVNPYAKVFNSGSIFLNLSFNRPTLAPDMNCVTDLKDLLGRRWIKTYAGELNGKILRQAMDETKRENCVGVESEPDIAEFDPEKIAQNTIEFYKSFVN
jgi:beta-1,4-mannosyltransferase